MAGLMVYPNSDLEVGLGLSRSPDSIAQDFGIRSLAQSTADVKALNEQQLQSMPEAIRGAAGGIGRMSPPAQPTIMYDPTSNKMFAGGQVFDANDVRSAMAASQNLNVQAAPPPGFAGQSITPDTYRTYMQNLATPRSFGQDLALGARQALESTVGGIGRGLELAGATEVGPAIAEGAEKMFGQTEYEKQRSALIRQSNSVWSNLRDAIVQGLPTTIPTILASVGGAALGGPAGAALGFSATAGRTVGSLVGAAASVFPMELQGFYEAAQQNGYDTKDPQVQSDMLIAASGTTFLQSLMPAMAGKGFSAFFSDAAKKVGQDVAQKSLVGAARARAVGGSAAIGGLEEAFAEGVSQLAQQAVFDPKFREQLNASDWKALAPYIVEKYGEDTLLAAGAGFFLGAGFGGAGKFIETRPTNLLDVAGEKEADKKIKETPAQGELFPGQNLGTAPQAKPVGPAPMPKPTGEYQMELPFTNQFVNPNARGTEPYGPNFPQGYQFSMPFREQQMAPQQVGPAGMFGELPFQQAPARPAVQQSEQLTLPFGGQQMELPLSGAAPQPVARPAGDTALGAALLKAQEAARAKAEAPTVKERNRLQKIIDNALAQVEAQMAQDAQAEADIRAARLPRATEPVSPRTEPSQMSFPGMGALKRGAAVQPQTTVAPEVQGPSAQLPLFNPYGGASISADQLQGPIPLQGPAPLIGPVDLRKGAQSNATQTGQVEQGSVGQYQNAGGRLEVQPQDRNVPPKKQEGGGKAGGRNRLVKGAAPQEQVTGAPPTGELYGEGAAPSTAPEPKPSEPAKAPPSVEEVPLRGGGRSSSILSGTEPPAVQPVTAPVETTFGPAIIEGPKNDVVAKLQKDVDFIKGKMADLDAKAGSMDYDVYLRRSTDLENNLKAAQQSLDNAINAQAVENTSPTPGKFSTSDWNTINGAVDAESGKPITQPLTVNRIRTVISDFVSKLAQPPRVRIYKDQADMARRDPAYYQQAIAARKEGDFDSVNAAGYSFGIGDVVIFTDRIANEAHLKFVLAHEALGHYGMRSIVPAADFERLMTRIYDTDSKARDAADSAMAVRGLSKAEAVEEYLSDYAAILDKSVVLRVWNGIKNFISSLGVKFDDTATRYLLDQARRYVRTGQTSSAFDPAAVADRYNLVEKGLLDTGRFSHIGQFVGDNEKAGLLYGDIGGWPTNFSDAWERTKASGLDTTESWDKFKSKFLSLMNYRALQNPGLRAFDELMGETSTISMQLKVMSNETLRTVYDASTEQKNRMSEAMYAARSYAASKLKSLSQLGKTPLYSITDTGEFVLNEAEARRLIKEGSLTFDQMKNGFEWNVTYEGLDGKTVTEKRKFAGYKDITEKSIEWTGYQKVREAMAEIELRLLRARYTDEVGERQLTYKELGVLMPDKKLSKSEEQFINDMVKKYRTMYTENMTVDDRGYPVFDRDAMERGNQFIVDLNTAIQANAGATSRANFLSHFAQGSEKIGTQFDAFKERAAVSDMDKFLLQNKVKQLVLSELSNNDAELYTKRTLATGYVPVLRSGEYEVRVEARDATTGKRVTLKDAHKQMMTYSQFDKATDAQAMAQGVDKIFLEDDGKRKTYDVLAFNESTRQYQPTKVTLHARNSAALDAVAVAPELNLNDFVRGLRQFDINITPAKMEQIVTSLTKQNAAARNRLEFSGTPGYDTKAGIYAISRHIESRASTVAKISTRSRMRELMNLNLPATSKLWHGDIEKVMATREAFDAISNDPKASPEAVVAARRDFDKAMFMYKQTNPEASGWDGKRDTFAQFDTGTAMPEKSMQYYNEAARTLSFLEGNRFVDESDFGAGPVASAVRSYTSMVQLGGSVAQGILNFLSVGTNWLPYMASYNHNNAFGGGFSTGKVMSEFTKATMQVGAPGINMLTEGGRAFNTAEFYEQLSTNPILLKKHGLLKHEAEFLAREIREGKMIPAQSNALVGTARGRITNNYMRRFIDTFMAPFNLSEQAVRRAAGLAAYRLEYNRAIAAGKSESAAIQQARDFAVNSIDLTLGEYSVLNRPPAWRDGIQSFLYMYKVYPTTTIQLFSNLSRNGKIGMLGALWAVSGAMGLPFAEDAEDLVDTLSQTLGFKSGSIRAELTKELEQIFPGMSDLFFKGLLHSALPIPADVASRAGVGNIIPATGLLLAGANVGQELKDLTGPAPSMLLGLATTAKDLISVPFSERKSLEDVARESPITIVRALGDVSAYLNTGAVVDRRGYVVSPQMDAGIVLTRLLGFYPKVAADQYEMVRVSNRIVDYQKDVALGFRQAWVKAMIRNDYAEAQQIAEAVNQWNQGTQGTALYIPKFISSAQRALREAQRPAGERALRAAPKNAQRELRSISDAMLAD